MSKERGKCILCSKRTRRNIDDTWICVSCCDKMKNTQSLDGELTKDEANVLRQVEKAGLSPKELQLLLRSPSKSKVSARTYNHATDGHVRIGIISDTHIGQEMFDEGIFKHAGETFRKLGIENVYHVGDILEGVSMIVTGKQYQFLHDHPSHD